MEARLLLGGQNMFPITQIFFHNKNLEKIFPTKPQKNQLIVTIN